MIKNSRGHRIMDSYTCKRVIFNVHSSHPYSLRMLPLFDSIKKSHLFHFQRTSLGVMDFLLYVHAT